jgi:hypothetical protein
VENATDRQAAINGGDGAVGFPDVTSSMVNLATRDPWKFGLGTVKSDLICGGLLADDGGQSTARSFASR